MVSLCTLAWIDISVQHMSEVSHLVTVVIVYVAGINIKNQFPISLLPVEATAQQQLCNFVTKGPDYMANFSPG